MSGEAKQRRWAGIAFVLVFVLLGVLVAAMDGRKAWHVLQHADWGVLPAAGLLTAVSYICLSAGYAAISRIFGIRLPAIDLIEIGFVSFAVNMTKAPRRNSIRSVIWFTGGLAWPTRAIC